MSLTNFLKRLKQVEKNISHNGYQNVLLEGTDEMKDIPFDLDNKLDEYFPPDEGTVDEHYRAWLTLSNFKHYDLSG